MDGNDEKKGFPGRERWCGGMWRGSPTADENCMVSFTAYETECSEGGRKKFVLLT